jgi:hypothetical protein
MRENLLPLVVGAYAALPADRRGQAALYAGLAERGLATALEIPDTHLLNVPESDLAWLAEQLRGRFAQSVVTAIPGTMKRQGKEPAFGLASPDEPARRAAVSFIRELRRAAEQLNQTTGENSVRVLQIHSAPSGTGTPEAFSRSLEELASGDWSTRLVIEHCDGRSERFPGEKRFLQAADEIRLAREHGLGLTVNWGRSALEGQDPRLPLQHIRQAVAAGVLEGLMFSGAGEAASQYGGPWADAHLPLSADEPTSLMDPEAVATCLRAAGAAVRYRGVKVQTPHGADVPRRLDVIGNAVAAVLRGNES